jgi:microcin C transport system substrate-binding protein
MRAKIRMTAILGLVGVVAAPAWASQAAGAHAIAMYGDLKYGPNFRHFDYVDPQAPKGGDLREAALGTYDSFNPFILKGTAAGEIGRIYDTLLTASMDEPFSMYGLLAERVEVPNDRSWVKFTLNAAARWHDGKPVTADDVIWTFQTLIEKGLPTFRGYYAGVDHAEKLDDRTVKFVFKPGQNRELPLILGQFAVLPKHYWEKREFDQTTLDPPFGSGPYEIDGFEAGRWIRYRRVPDYWGRDLPVNVGRNNFDTVRIDYYRDDTVAIEALKAGAYDLRLEISSKDWATSYDVPAVKTGALRKQAFPNRRPAGMQGYAFNIRRSIFQDPRVRAALAYAFDFEWSNATLFYGQYTRERSYFDNSELAATGLPSPAELEILGPYRGRIPEEVFTRAYRPPATDGSGNIRTNLRTAATILQEAGWRIDPQTQVLTNAESGLKMEFEILLVVPLFERVTLPFTKNLERLGVKARVRTADAAQYEERIKQFDFDMIVQAFPESLSPGNEQRYYWDSQFADAPGSMNVIGIKNPVIDNLVELVVSAPDRQSLVTRVHALDRVLQWGHYVIPQWYIGYDRLVFWDKFGYPEVVPEQGVQIDTWWVDPAKGANIKNSKD